MAKKKTVGTATVEATEATATVKKTRAKRQNFKEKMMKQIKAKTKALDLTETYDALESIDKALETLQNLMDMEKARNKKAKSTFKKLAKFSESDIREYLSSING